MKMEKGGSNRTMIRKNVRNENNDEDEDEDD